MNFLDIACTSLTMALLTCALYPDSGEVAGVAFGDDLLAADLVRIWHIGLSNSLRPSLQAPATLNLHLISSRHHCRSDRGPSKQGFFPFSRKYSWILLRICLCLYFPLLFQLDAPGIVLSDLFRILMAFGVLVQGLKIH